MFRTFELKFRTVELKFNVAEHRFLLGVNTFSPGNKDLLPQENEKSHRRKATIAIVTECERL